MGSGPCREQMRGETSMLGVDGSANTQGSGGPQTCAQAPLGLFGLHPIEMCPFPEGEGAHDFVFPLTCLVTFSELFRLSESPFLLL